MSKNRLLFLCCLILVQILENKRLFNTFKSLTFKHFEINDTGIVVQVSDVAHGPFVICFSVQWFKKQINVSLKKS